MNLNFEKIQRHIFAIAESKNISMEEAENLLEKSVLILEANEEINNSYALQLAFFTCYNMGNRIFKGGVKCILPIGAPNLLKTEGDSFNEALNSLFSINQEVIAKLNSPKILFGKSPKARNQVEVICSSWQAGLNVYESERVSLKNRNSELSLGACLSSSFALFWAFEYTFEITGDLQTESFGYSLWNSSLKYQWFEKEAEGPENVKIPSKIWNVGLGHLGQSYIWTLSHFKKHNDLKFLLQDFDNLGIENLGSQILSFASQIGSPKTRVCLDFLSKMKINCIIIEKKFVKNDQIDDSLYDYKVLITGLDNSISRSIINTDRFELCLDGATNGSLLNFDSFTFRNLKLCEQKPNEIWDPENVKSNILHKNLHKMVVEKGGCGELTNFGISTPFVGLFGSCILISELVKSCNSGKSSSIFSGK